MIPLIRAKPLFAGRLTYRFRREGVTGHDHLSLSFHNGSDIHRLPPSDRSWCLKPRSLRLEGDDEVVSVSIVNCFDLNLLLFHSFRLDEQLIRFNDHFPIQSMITWRNSFPFLPILWHSFSLNDMEQDLFPFAEGGAKRVWLGIDPLFCPRPSLPPPFVVSMRGKPLI